MNQLFLQLLFDTMTDEVQHCDYEKVPLCAERRYQPIKIAYLHSLSILIGASSEFSGAERTLL